LEPDGIENVTFRWKVVAEEVDLKIEATPFIESNEGNNAEEIYLDLRPNLSFYGDKVNFSKSNPKVNETITIKAYVQNSGGDVEDAVIRFFWDEKVIGSITADIDYNEVEEISIEWIVPDKPNTTLLVKAEIDQPDSIGDGSEATKSIVVAEKEKEIEPPVIEPKDEESEQFDYVWFIISLIIAIIAWIIGFLFGRMGKREPDLPQEQYPPKTESEEQQLQGESEKEKSEDSSEMQPMSPPQPQDTLEQGNFESTGSLETNEPNES
jgi:hypothetical protein